MTAPLVRPGTSPRALAMTARPAKGTGLLAIGLVAATCAAGVGAAPLADAAPAAPLTRVVVSAAGAGAQGVSAAAAAVAAAGGTVLDHLPLVEGVSAELPAGTTLAPGFSVVADRPIQLASGTADSGATPSTVRGALGLGAPGGQGRGTTIAVVDTGVHPHPDLAGRLTHVDVTGTAATSGRKDSYGHGTFVAGVAAGSGGTYAGVAPGADVLDVRVARADGSTDLVTVLAGLEQAAAGGADVVNLSLSSYSPLPWQVDPLTVALTRMWESGTVVVVPAGNDGPESGTVTSPGIAPALLTVGALDTVGTDDRSDDVVADFSARGPAPQDIAKPELVAPGRSVVSLRAAGSLVDAANPAARVGDGYFRGSGTSFSTAATAGAAAVLLADRPTLGPDSVKALLSGTARATGTTDVHAAGAGALDLVAAAAAADPAVIAAPLCRPGKGKKASPCTQGRSTVPGAPGHWKQFIDALASEDPQRAASSWSKMPPEVHAWVASSWSILPEDLRAELILEGRSWAGGTPTEWAQREWAGRSWAASSWSGRSWAASSWSGRSWAGRSWAGRSWAGRSWAGRSWAGRSWAGRSWAGRSWAGRSWATDTWTDDAWAAQWGS